MKMKFTEIRQVEIELEVARCLKCHSEDIKFSDYGYTQGNSGGGTCQSCKHEFYKPVFMNPKIEDLVAIWNSGNDVKTLIKVEQDKIEEAERKISEIKAKAPVEDWLEPLNDLAKQSLMTAEEFEESYDTGGINSDDGDGYWATDKVKSEISCFDIRPDWATHVVFYGK